jgi:hypothetical protein
VPFIPTIFILNVLASFVGINCGESIAPPFLYLIGLAADMDNAGAANFQSPAPQSNCIILTSLTLGLLEHQAKFTRVPNLVP